MAISLPAPTALLPIPGVRISTAAAGIKYSDRDDLVLFELSANANTAVVLTKNQFCAAPVEITRNHLTASPAKYLLINSGNANAGLGKQGIADAKQTCTALATAAKCAVSQVLPFSTGVIGTKLPVEKITQKIPALLSQLEENQWLAAAKAIMTTDTVAKGYTKQLGLGGETVSITGIAKGSGMIRPDMATMLAYVGTDLKIEDEELNALLIRTVDQSFHCITVDGDTSTNDAAVLVATGNSRIKFSELSEAERMEFELSLHAIFVKLAQAIIRDGEGATKFITVSIEHAENETMARKIAFAIANSPLVKTAAFAGDPNWGRVLAAAGRATDELLKIGNIALYINDLKVIQSGEVAGSYNENSGQKEMQKDEIQFRLSLGAGESAARVWSTDLSYDYVKINAEYRT